MTNDNKISNSMSKKNDYRVLALRPAEINDALISAWADLEARANIPNAFMSPYFVMPAIKYLEVSSDILGVFVEKTHGGFSSLVGVALFKVNKPMRRFPLTHLAAFASIHSYLSGFLIDREYASEALEKIYEFITRKIHPWHGLYVNNGPPESIFAEETKIIADGLGMRWITLNRWQRAIFRPSDHDKDVSLSLSKNQRKNYKRYMRQLQELGDLEWRFIRGGGSPDSHIDEFIRLEHMGWKGMDGTSLYSDPNHVNFFREMIRGFNLGNRVFFTELSINGKTISSTSNLISGNAGFAFKVGWDTDFAKYAPGIVNEIQMIEHQKDILKGLDFIDSSAAPESYINSLWTGRRDIIEGFFTFTTAGKLALAGVRAVKKVKLALFPRQHDKKIPILRASP